MTFLLIDPPVHAGSHPLAIAEWILRLDAMAVEFAGDEKALERIAAARREAEKWLERSNQIGG
jgi:hypothetical protein